MKAIRTLERLINTQPSRRFSDFKNPRVRRKVNVSSKEQAWRAIKDSCKNGYMLKASAFECWDCGKPAHDYDHAKGYVFWWYVEPVCRSCHIKRELARGVFKMPVPGARWLKARSC